jgi:hypothetical protein
MNDLAFQLQAPFEPEEIEWRIGRSGSGNKGIWATALAYIQNRAIMNRLDTIFGPYGWKNEFREWKSGKGQLCIISVKSHDGEWVSKQDGADDTQIEGTKGGLSDSMKRAAVQWGIGRYLYNLEETWVVTQEKKPQNLSGWNYATTKDKKSFYWQNPKLPAWALPKKGIRKPTPENNQPEKLADRIKQKVEASKTIDENLDNAPPSRYTEPITDGKPKQEAKQNQNQGKPERDKKDPPTDEERKIFDGMCEKYFGFDDDAINAWVIKETSWSPKDKPEKVFHSSSPKDVKYYWQLKALGKKLKAMQDQKDCADG